MYPIMNSGSKASQLAHVVTRRFAPIVATRALPSTILFSRNLSSLNFFKYPSKGTTPKTFLQSLRFASIKPEPISGKPVVKCEIDYMNLCEEKFELSHHLHPTWSDEELKGVRIVHTKPKTFSDYAAHLTVQTLRLVFDVLTGYKFGKKNEACFIRRIIILETIAGVPGMVGAMNRHLSSLRKMKRDYGWIHTLLEEAENERMHLMSALLLIEKPARVLRWVVMAGQMGFMCYYALMYAISPKFCHRFVGYIEEEAVKTYTTMIHKLEAGLLPGLEIEAPEVMAAYWHLKPGATITDVIYNIRADESHHREVNHAFADLKCDDVNPFEPGY